jgi:NADH-quinone oxidoreductase subunit G
MQGNVVDICPVGALLDKDFLFKERVWNLKRTPSICPSCSTGCAVSVDSAEAQVKRLKPRFNPGVNDYWMCDEGRFGFHYLHDAKRLTQAVVKRGLESQTPTWEQLVRVLRLRVQAETAADQGQRLAVVLSPMMSVEEAWLLGKFIRSLAPKAVFFMGHVPTLGQEQHFPLGADGKPPKFTIRTEKCPNRRGVEAVLASLGGPVQGFGEFVKRAGTGEFESAWISGGYPGEWVTKEWSGCLGKLPFLIAHDLFPSLLTEAATIIIPACGFAEREGSFMNHAGRLQPFKRAIMPPDGCKRDGQFFFELASMSGVYNAEKVRELMRREIKDFPEAVEPPEVPEHQH